MDRESMLEAFMFRHACKEFDAERKIEKADFTAILEAGRLSPSSFGYEPWKFVVLQNMRVRERLVPVTWGARKSLPTASHYVVLLARTKAGMLPESDYVQRMMREVHRYPEEIMERATATYRNFLVNDFKLMDDERAFFDWSCKQAYIALGNMMTAAALLGIDSCPIEGYDQEAVERILREEGVLGSGAANGAADNDAAEIAGVGVAANGAVGSGDVYGLACMCAFGYRVKEPRPKTRLPVEEVVEWVE